MKTKLTIFLTIASIAFGILFVFGFEKEEKIHLNLDLNEEYLNLVSEKSEKLVEGNDEKFGKDTKKSKIDLQITDLSEVQSHSNFIEYNTNLKGHIKTPSGNFNFTGTGELFLTQIFEDKWIYTGSYVGTIKNKKGEETLNISLRYDPETKESDVVVVSGVVYESGILPFGKPFLFDKDLNEIDRIKNEYKKGE